MNSMVKMGNSEKVNRLKSWKHFAFLISGIGTLQYICLTIIAMVFYPGGYSFFELWLSDLGLTISIVNQEPNYVSRIIYIIACAVFCVGLSIFWLLIPKFFSETKQMKIICWLSSIFGILSGIFVFLIAITPYDIREIRDIHHFVARLYLTFSMLSLITFSFAIFLNKSRNSKNIYINLALAIFIFFSLFNIFPLFISVVGRLPLIQKVCHYGYSILISLQIYQIWKEI